MYLLFRDIYYYYRNKYTVHLSDLTVINMVFLTKEPNLVKFN